MEIKSVSMEEVGRYAVCTSTGVPADLKRPIRKQTVWSQSITILLRL